LAQQDLNFESALPFKAFMYLKKKRTEIEAARKKKQVQRFLLIKGIYSSMLERTTEMNFCFVVPNGKESLHSNAAEF
jgi:hypothetical protein